MNVIKYPLSTEKSIRLMESENKLVFIVERKARKGDIKEELEKIFKVKVKHINTLITPEGKKKAYIFITNDINLGEFENFGIDCFVNTACPRMDLVPEGNLINLGKLEKLLNSA